MMSEQLADVIRLKSMRFLISLKKLIEKVLDYHSLRGEAGTEMSTVMRHFFKYAQDKAGTDDVKVSDDLLMDFFTKELPKTNKGSMGRSLRAIKCLSVYLKDNGNADLVLDFTQLNARGHHIRLIPTYSQEEINRAVSSIDTTTPRGLRDYAIILLAFDTGLRSVDIRRLCLQDIDWKKGMLYLAQSKTAVPQQIAFCAVGFDEIPVTNGIYAGGGRNDNQ